MIAASRPTHCSARKATVSIWRNLASKWHARTPRPVRSACARGALEDSIAYAKQRVQFGEPIGDFQAIRFKLAHMATEIEAARQLMYYVCTLSTPARRCDLEAAWSNTSPLRWPSA